MKKDIIVILLAVMLVAVFVLNTDFKTVEEYYTEHADDISEGDETVFISIRCDSIFENADKLDPTLKDIVPKNGAILERTEYVLRSGDTVFDVLVRAIRKNKLQMEYRGSKDNAYIAGISYIYEFSCGELSGWSFYVNGKLTQVGASAYKPCDGDVIEWVYTCDLPRDLIQGGASNE